ncbi:COG complex component [Vararia minispora EC-137]|uniref:COG complex component n=1 Tax=Vararia minispora EC-137 TaxID=1314806 RepID=A0ACB8QEA3_9AGAM|nr:COG complex component [Vararia minispora EC-137]
MASRTASGSVSRDPFELERLAQELAEREQLSPKKSLSFPDTDTSIELPLYAPLSHDNPHFTSDTFNVEEFLLSRTHTSLPELRTELRDYLAKLKEELVKLINDDYEAFISLSTDLRGEGARMERLKMPLGDLRAQVLESREELQSVQNSIQNKLKKRSALREEKAFLHLLLKISESVTRLESLLLIASPDDDASPKDSMPMAKSLSADDDGHDERTRGNRAKHLSRVAAEYTQLLYHVAKSQSEGSSAFVDDIQWRINRIQSTLSSDLDHLFVVTLTSLADTQNKSDRSKLFVDVSECLKTYDMMGLWRDAEDVLRRDLVREFVKKVEVFSILAATASLPPRTPYTPFTAFASKDLSFDTASATAHLLDDYGNALAGLYNTILKFVERDIKQIMDIAEKVSSKSKGKEPATGSDIESRTFEILANVVWAEVGRAIMDELGSVVFAAGKPNEFRKNHETTQAFIRSLQFLAPSAQAVEAMVKHPTFQAFERRWQLPVYFQLRWKEIVIPLEEALATPKLEPMPGKDSPFASKQAAAAWHAVEICWSGDVFLPQLAHRFWKLSLQALSRYRTWLESVIPTLDPNSKMPSSAARERLDSPGGTPRSSTPNSNSENMAADTAAEDATLRQLSLAMVDIKALETQMWRLWREAISIMLPEPAEDDDEAPPFENALQATISSLTNLIPLMSTQIISILSRRACEALTPVRSIPSQFRAMSNKKMPGEASYFIDAIMRPVKAFFAIGTADGPGAGLQADCLRPYAEEVFEAVVQKFISYLAGLKKTEESLRRLKKGKKSTFSLFGGANTQHDDNRDEERIRMQMILDVKAFGKDAAALGVDVENSASFRALDELVHASFADDSTSA